MAIIKPNNNTISAITSLPAAIPTGKILQIQHASSTSGVTTTSTSFSDIVSVNITPSSASNKIYVMLSVMVRKVDSAASNNAAGLQLLRDSTNISTIVNYAAWNDNNTVREQETITYNHLDSGHSTTSQITYKLQGRSMGTGTMSFNNDTSYCYITAMEISA